MQMKFSNAVATLAAAMFVSTAAAHPGHSPADLGAEVSQPLAGLDHFAAFAALASVLLVALRFILKARAVRKMQLQEPRSR